MNLQMIRQLPHQTNSLANGICGDTNGFFPILMENSVNVVLLVFGVVGLFLQSGI